MPQKPEFSLDQLITFSDRAVSMLIRSNEVTAEDCEKMKAVRNLLRRVQADLSPQEKKMLSAKKHGKWS